MDEILFRNRSKMLLVFSEYKHAEISLDNIHTMKYNQQKVPSASKRGIIKLFIKGRYCFLSSQSTEQPIKGGGNGVCCRPEVEKHTHTDRVKGEYSKSHSLWTTVVTDKRLTSSQLILQLQLKLPSLHCHGL